MILRSIAIVLVILLSGCAIRNRMGKDLPTTFLEGSDLSEKKERLPFDHSWSNEQANWNGFHSVFVAPIRTDLLADDAWSGSRSTIITSKSDYQSEAAQLAEYFREQILAELKKRPGGRFSNVAEKPGAGTLTLEIAFTELQFSHPVARAGTFAVPLPGTSIAFAAMSDPFVSFAAKLKDGASGKVVATAADRKFAPTRIIDFNKFTVTSSNREICALWAQMIAETLASDEMAKVKERSWSWLPW